MQSTQAGRERLVLELDVAADKEGLELFEDTRGSKHQVTSQ
jgi:hypothetical protein